MKKLILLYSLFCITTLGFSQIRQSHVSFYGGDMSGHSYGSFIKTDKDGNYFVAGNSSSNNTNFDYATVKYNSSGVMLWERRYNGEINGVDELLSLFVDENGNAYVTGTSRYDNFTRLFECVTIKYSPKGEVLWTNKYRNELNLNVKGSSIAVNQNGDVFVSGYIGNNNSMDILLIMLNKKGEKIWDKVFDANSYRHDYPDNLFVYKDHIYVCGGAIINPLNNLEMIVLKYDMNGNLIWYKSQNGEINATDIAKSVFVDKNENVYITGYTENRRTLLDITTLKYNSSGELLWINKFNGTSNGFDWANHVLVDEHGNVYVEGGSQNEREINPDCESKLGGCKNDATLIKYLPSGEMDWFRLYNGTDNMYDCFQGMVLDNKNNIYVAGRSRCSETNDDIITMKFNSRGEQIWFMKYNSGVSQIDYGSSIAIDNFGNVFTSGWSEINGVTMFTSIKYSPTSIYADNFQKIKIDNYPNPFNPVTNIIFSLPITQYTILKVFDIAGREVATLVNEKLQPGSYEFTFDAGRISSGVYFYQLKTDEFIQTRKMVLQK